MLEEPEQPLYDEAGYQDEGGAEPTPDAAAPVGGGGGEEVSPTYCVPFLSLTISPSGTCSGHYL